MTQHVDLVVPDDEAARISDVLAEDLGPHLRAPVLALLRSGRPERVPALVALDDEHSPRLFEVRQALHRAQPGVVASVVLSAGFGWLEPRGWWDDEWEHLVLHPRRHDADLETITRLLDEAGGDGAGLVWRSWSRRYFRVVLRDRTEAELAAWARAHLDTVLHTRPEHDVDDQVVFDVLGLLDPLPDEAVDWLYAAAVGPAKTHRPRARALLAPVAGPTGRTDRLVADVSRGRAAARQHAAEWLAAWPDPAALPALEKAVATEKLDPVRAALIDALEALGRPTEAYLDADGLLAEAAAAQAKGWPATTTWLDVASLPRLRWASSGAALPTVVVQHLLARATRSKSPEPNAILRKYAALLDEGDRHAFARALLAAWLAEDERRGAAFTGGPSSAVDCKGLLAVVAACAGPDVVGVVERFVREHYGWRAAQCKALLPMLAWVDQPGAVQVVLSIGTRFRTKGIKDVAWAQVQAIAERAGWTVDELADRTVSTAGFDDGDLELSYGPRTFTVTLMPDLTLRVTDAGGAVLTALPAPRVSDDEDAAAVAKKAFAATRKEVTAIAKAQQQRLHAAMCAERAWPVADWRAHLLDHVVVGRLVRRLVWLAGPVGEAPAVAFRPLDDGSLADVDDEAVELDPTWQVRLAHDVLLGEGDVRRWVEHLADYEVAPLFHQLGRGAWEVPPELRDATELAEVEGHVVTHFRLRSTATRLGWTRGEVGDGPSFVSYDQTWPALGVVARIGFSGSPMPEVDEPRALHRLSFVRLLAEGRGEAPMTLGEVPRVLLAETRHDLIDLAATGSGYDPDWKALEY